MVRHCLADHGLVERPRNADGLALLAAIDHSQSVSASRIGTAVGVPIIVMTSAHLRGVAQASWR
jgi:hypothetical protein